VKSYTISGHGGRVSPSTLVSPACTHSDSSVLINLECYVVTILTASLNNKLKYDNSNMSNQTITQLLCVANIVQDIEKYSRKRKTYLKIVQFD
jgi:hypothetical protein